MLDWHQHAKAQLNLREANLPQGSEILLESLEKSVKQAMNISILPFIIKLQEKKVLFCKIITCIGKHLPFSLCPKIYL